MIKLAIYGAGAWFAWQWYQRHCACQQPTQVQGYYLP